jgi:SAM-dependent methyltransferase
LADFNDETFDAVIGHNVLEFAAGRAEIVKEFSRVLKRGEILSVVKNNGAGRVMSLAVRGNDVDGALDLLGGGHISNIFGQVDLYDPEELELWDGSLKIEKLLAVQTFYALQQNDELKHVPEWINKMFEIEMRVCDMEPYKSVSLFNHVLLRKM